eukprot:1161986-Pelagomonas_calceolata.AAC.2
MEGTDCIRGQDLRRACQSQLTQAVILGQAARTANVGRKRCDDFLELAQGGLRLKLSIILRALWVLKCMLL